MTRATAEKLGLAFVLALLISLCPVFVFAQAISGDLTGTVLDAHGAAVNGATVSAVNVATGQKAETVTKGTGEYRISNLPIGHYTVTVTAPNFNTTTLQNVPVELNKTNTANVTLQVGQVSTTVEVTGAPAVIDTTTAQLQSTYNNTFAENLGLAANGGIGGGVLNLSLLSPGVAQANSMAMGAGPSVGGQRPRNNNFTIEGVDNNSKSVTGFLATVPNDSVESFSLLENQFNPEFGHSSGGQFNTVVKSGTNNFHGSLYEYFRNRNMNAEDQLYKDQGLTSNPRFDSNRYGATFGGPIIKNKLFFFDNFERQPVGLAATPSGGATYAPTSAGLAAIAADPNISSTNLGVFQKYVPVAPANTQCVPYNGHLGGDPSAAAFSPFSAPANGSCGAGTLEVGVIPTTAPSWLNFENFVQAIDFNISDRDQFRGRYVYNKTDQIDPANGATPLPAFFTTIPVRSHLIALSEYHTFNPSLTNELRVGFNRYDQIIPGVDFKFPGLDAFPNLYFFDMGPGGLTLGGDTNSPQFTIQNWYGAQDNISWTKGSHQLKFGVEFREYISPQSFTQRQFGDYEWNISQLYFEDFSPDNFGQRSSGAITYYGNQQALYWYANDTWRVNPHLSLNLGIRYEYTSIPLGEHNQQFNTISNTPNLIVPLVNEPLTFEVPRAPKNKFNWAPRIGIAYSPGTSGNTSIRAGFGMAYDVLYDNIGILSEPPQVGATINCGSGAPQCLSTSSPSPQFLANGGLPGGGSGLTQLSEADARANTSSWIPTTVKWPYSISWNLGVQHAFGGSYTADVRYVGTRGNRLDVQDIVNLRSIVSPSHFLPTYLQNPGQAALNALPLTLASMENEDPFLPAFEAAGFQSPITAFIPEGWSTYHGLQTELTKRMKNGLMVQAAYTWSRTIDNSTADFHTTDLTPRRPQDFQNLTGDKAVSALSRTHRFSLAMVYETQFFKSNSNWLMKNVIGNWNFSPVYVYESPEWATVQANRDANLNGDSAGDRAIFNSAGVPGTGTGVTALTNSAGDTVAYLANDPTAQYIRTGAGALSNLGRNTLATAPTNNLDLNIYKALNITESKKVTLGAQFNNILNHAQFIPGSVPGLGLGVNDVNPGSFTTTGASYKNYLTPGKASFNDPSATFSSNPRTIGLVLKFIF
jgi:hypothetical protein